MSSENPGSGREKPVPTVLMDVNVFIDIFQRRKGYVKSFRAIQAVRSGRLKGVLSPITPAISILSQEEGRSRQGR